jgi:anti-anti-sigma regulatory factor
MFKISIVETQGQRKLVLEGTLVGPWTTEVERSWRSAGEQLEGRKLVIDLSNVTVIGADGENMLLKLMSDGAKFSCGGVLTKHVLKQLARRCRCSRKPL